MAAYDLQYRLAGDADDLAAARSAVRHLAADLDMDVETVAGAAEDDERRRNRIHITLMGAPLTPAAVAQAAAEIAERGGNIDRIRRIASYPVTAIEFQGSGVAVADLRRPLALVAAQHGADIAVQEAGLDRRGQYRNVAQAFRACRRPGPVPCTKRQIGPGLV